MSKPIQAKNCTAHDAPVVFSFFSGSGFLDLGFEYTGYEIVFVNEISSTFLDAYKHSRLKMGITSPRYGYYNIDVGEFLNGRKEELRHLVDESRNRGRLVGFIGGPPCPDFSIAGKNKGADGESGKLSLMYANLLREMMPDFFLFENVKGMWSTARHRAFFEEIRSELHKAGYSTSERLCNALEFGVPQDRERILLFGVRGELLKTGAAGGMITVFPWDRFVKYSADEVKCLPWSSTNDFGGDAGIPLEDTIEPLTVQYWFDKNDVDNHPNATAHFTPRGGIEKMRTVPEGDVSRKSYKRLHRYRFSPTAAYGNNEVHLHPYKARRISAAEAMAIQSMPKDFELPSNMSLSSMFKTIGNGVPFLLSEGIAKTIRVFLEESICKK